MVFDLVMLKVFSCIVLVLFNLMVKKMYLVLFLFLLSSSRCLNGVYCSNRRFQMKQHADFEVILTESKGWGLRAARDLQP